MLSFAGLACVFLAAIWRRLALCGIRGYYPCSGLGSHSRGCPAHEIRPDLVTGAGRTW